MRRDIIVQVLRWIIVVGASFLQVQKQAACHDGVLSGASNSFTCMHALGSASAGSWAAHPRREALQGR
jgi:hypothetical protein